MAQGNAQFALEQVKLPHYIGSVMKREKKYAFRHIGKNVTVVLGIKNADLVKEKERLNVTQTIDSS